MIDEPFTCNAVPCQREHVAMAKKEYSIILRSPGQEPHYQIQLNVTHPFFCCSVWMRSAKGGLSEQQFLANNTVIAFMKRPVWLFRFYEDNIRPVLLADKNVQQVVLFIWKSCLVAKIYTFISFDLLKWIEYIIILFSFVSILFCVFLIKMDKKPISKRVLYNEIGRW